MSMTPVYVAFLPRWSLTPMLDHDPTELTFILGETKQAIIVNSAADVAAMTASTSMASMLAMTNASVLAGYTLAKLLNPEGANCLWKYFCATDMRGSTVHRFTGVCPCQLRDGWAGRLLWSALSHRRGPQRRQAARYSGRC